MINSDRRARMLLNCAMEGGDPAVTELVQNIGAETAWAKITEGVLGEPAAQRAAAVPTNAVEGLANASDMRFVVPNPSNDAVVNRWGSGCAVHHIWPTLRSVRSRSLAHGQRRRTATGLRPILLQISSSGE